MLDSRGHFADTRQHLARKGNGGFGKFLSDDAARRLLMRGVRIREEVADGDGTDVRRFQVAHRVSYRVGVEGHEHVARVVGPLGDLLGQALRRDRRGLRVKIVDQHRVARLVLNLLYGAEALRDEEANARAAHLEQRVRGDRRAVAEKAHAGGIDTLGGEFRDTREHA